MLSIRDLRYDCCSIPQLECGWALKPGPALCVFSKVHGTTNIRVVDLSVVPLHIGCHTQGSTSLLAQWMDGSTDEFLCPFSNTLFCFDSDGIYAR